MSSVQEYLVSASGQMSLPAAARHRWNLDAGGPVDVLDLGFGVLIVPKGEGRRLLGGHDRSRVGLFGALRDGDDIVAVEQPHLAHIADAGERTIERRRREERHLRRVLTELAGHHAT